MRRIFCLLICLSFTAFSFAQNTREARQAEKKERINAMIKQQEEGVITYRKSFVFGAKLISDGYGIFFEVGRASSVQKATLYQLEISERKSVKEEKLNGVFSNTVPYIYGKENFFYPVKLGVQQQQLLGNKSNKNGVQITGNYGGGLSVAVLRPYYLQVQEGNGFTYVKYNSSDSAQFLGGQIFGGPGLGKGWNELSFTPGVYGKVGLRFDYGAFNELISAIEVGINADFYAKKIPQMVYNKEKQFFFGAYAAILFGKRK